MKELRKTIRGARAKVIEKLSEPFMSNIEAATKAFENLKLKSKPNAFPGAVDNVEDKVSLQSLLNIRPEASLEALEEDLMTRDWEGSGMGAADPTKIINSLFDGKGTLDKHHELLDIERECFIGCIELMKDARGLLLKEAQQAWATSRRAMK